MLRAGDVGDVPVAGRDEVRQNKADAFVLVMRDRGDLRVVDAPVHGDDGEPFLGHARHRLVVALDARKDQPVDAARPQRLGDALLAA